MIVNKNQLADVLGVTLATLTTWQKNGLPMVLNAGRGGTNQYDTGKVIEWMIQRALAGAESETARERRDRLEGDLLELRLAKESGAVVAVDQVEPVWAGAILAARAELRGWGERLRAEIESRYRIEADPEIFAAAVDSVLLKLSEAPPDPEEAEAIEPEEDEDTPEEYDE